MSTKAEEKPNKDQKDAKKSPAADLLAVEELSEEDQALKEKLELCVERLSDTDAGLRQTALDMIKTEVAGATSSMTSVPKPLKFLTPLYKKLTEIYEAHPAADAFKQKLADLCSVVGMVAAPEETSDMLDYCLKGTLKDLISWGHEYLRALSGQIGKQFDKRVADGTATESLTELVDIIVPEFINHNEEPEAVDLMMETERLGKLNDFCNERNYARVCRYLCTCSQYAADTEEMRQSYKTAFDIYKTQNKFCEALQVAQKMNDLDLIKEIMEACKDPIELKQMAFMLGRQRNAYESDHPEL